MAYTIHKSDGTDVPVADNSLDTDYYTGTPPTSGGTGTGILLVGRNTIDYGAAIAQNFLQMTENFANTLMPADSYALQGQLWFKKDALPAVSGNLYVRVKDTLLGGMNNWEKIVTVDNGGSSTIDGNLDVTGDLTVDGAITSGGHRVSVVYTSTAAPGQDGDIAVETGPVISMYAGGAWRQVFPAIYS